MNPYLLDANVAIALAISDHVHHDRANLWLAGVRRAAMSPIVEGALARYLIRTGVTPSSVRRLVRAAYEDGRVELWPDDLSFAEVDLRHVTGHRQVTDSYLAGLATRHGGLLATFDEGLARTLPQQTFLVPE